MRTENTSMEKSHTTGHSRYEYLDILRGLTLISMILYHAMWDLVYLVGIKADWFRSNAAYIWQQSICWTFILLAGFCWSLGKKKRKRGSIVFAAGVVVSLVTWIVTPNQKIIFGVLTLLGTCMLLMIPLEKVLRRIPETIGLVLTAGIFLFTKGINRGYLGVEDVCVIYLPKAWYDGGYIPTFLGFMDRSFYSSDYFSLIPWMFLFLTGYFLYQIARSKGILTCSVLLRIRNKPLAYLGRHSLLLYLLHQPIIYLLVMCFFE